MTGFVHEGGRIRGVRTSAGVIESPVVVDAAGAWSALLADEVGIRIPMVPTRHQLFITEPIAGVEPHHPIVRIHEPSVYTRPEQGGLMLGGYEDQPLQIDMRKEPEGFQVRDLPLDVGVLWGLAGEVAAHFPALRGAKLREHRGGLPTISPDGEHIVGPVASLAGFYIASACNVGGLSISASVGRVLADLIVDGSSQPDLGRMSVERFRGRRRRRRGLALRSRPAPAPTRESTRRPERSQPPSRRRTSRNPMSGETGTGRVTFRGSSFATTWFHRARGGPRWSGAARSFASWTRPASRGSTFSAITPPIPRSGTTPPTP